MELYARVRRAVQAEGISEREAARQFGLARETVRKMLRYSIPPIWAAWPRLIVPSVDASGPIVGRGISGANTGSQTRCASRVLVAAENSSLVDMQHSMVVEFHLPAAAC